MAEYPLPDDDLPPLREPGLVGRERELGLLRQAAATPAALIVVEGEAGIGKSRLLTEFLAEARSGRALVAMCPPFLRPHTLGPLVDAIRLVADHISQLRLSPLAGALRPLFPEWADDLPPSPEPAEDPTAVRHRLFRALSELLDRLAISLLVVEDAHWADEATLEFLLFLCARREARMSLVLSYRPEDATASSLLRRLAGRQPSGMTVTRIELGPLDQQGTALLMASMLAGEQVSDEFAVFVHRHTDGIPLAVEESIRLMRDRADLTRRDGEWVRRELSVIDVPPPIRDAVLERVEYLSPDAQAVLRAAAVLAGPAREPVLAEVAGLPPAQLVAGLAEALEEGLLAEDRLGLVSFRHMLASRAVYESIRAAERAGLHRRAGATLRGVTPAPLAQLAKHFREARDAAAWCQYAEQAADAALAAGDELTANTMLHEVIIGARPPSRVLLRLIRKLTFGQLMRSGDFNELLGPLRAAAADPDLDAATRAELHAQAGRVLTVMDEHDAARSELELAIGGLRRDSFDAVRSMLWIGMPHNAQWTASEHLAWLRRAGESIESLPDGTRTQMRIILVNGLLLLGEQDGWAIGARLPTEPRSAGDRPMITQNLLNLGDLALRWGRHEEAKRYLSAALRAADKYQHVRVRKLILVTQAHLDWLTARWAGLAERATRLAGDSDVLAFAGFEGRLVAGLAHAACGDEAIAADPLERAQAEAHRRGVFEIMAEAAAGLCRVLLSAGRPADALAATDVPMGIVAGKGTWLWAADLGPSRIDALAAAGRAGEAAELVDGFAEWASDRDIPSASAGLLLSRACLAQARAEHEAAASLFAEAATWFDRLPRPYAALLATERRGACLLAAGQREPAVAALDDAARGLAALGADRDASRVAATLRRHGVSRTGRPGYRDRLSPRERDVAVLVVDGLTNRDIAARLCLSPRTVDRHVDSAMRKLGVSSRTALAVRVVEQDRTA